MRTFFFAVVLIVMCVGEALSAPPPYLRNPLTTNQLTIGFGISIAGDVLTSTGSGEVNVIGDAGLTNASRVSLSYSKAGVTNFLKTMSAANGLIRTNEGTNLSLAIDPAVVASQANLTAASNALLSASGNVFGPASSIDSALAVYDGTTGKLLKDSVIIVTNGTNLTIPGRLRIGNGTATNPSLVFAADDDGSGTGMYRSGVNQIGFSLNGTLIADFQSFGLNLPSASIISFAGDTFISREAVSILQLGSDTAAAANQTIKSTDGLGTDKIGGDFIFGAGRSTGTGVPGKIHLTVSTNSITSASTQNLYTNVVTIGSDTTGLTFVNRARFDTTTNDFALDTYYTNANQRAWASCSVGMTNILATDRAQVALYLDQNGDGTWERTGIEVRMQGVIALSGSEQLSAFLQPNGRFIFTNLSSGGSVSIIANSSQWVKQ